MRFSILHLSDLHRDLNDEVDNTCLLDSLELDVTRFDHQNPKIERPSLCIISGDLVYGVKANVADPTAELQRQYAQVEEFLIGLADRLFNGDRERIIIVPGNHDISYIDVLGSVERVNIPSESVKKTELVAELFTPRSRLRWSWGDLCFYRITDEDRYLNRLRCFATCFDSFYLGRRTFTTAPQQQYCVFDFSELNFCVLALNSCYNNDPLRRAGAFHPVSVTKACRALRETSRTGRLIAATWHHNLFGAASDDDYLDVGVLQLLIDAGVSLGFHGHQHRADCIDERYRIGPGGRKMTIVSAGTVCAGPRNLRPGIPRSYNVVELDTDAWTGSMHQRQMVNEQFSLPVWGPGHINATNTSYLGFTLCKPLMTRPANLDVQMTLTRADELLGARRWKDALDVLAQVKDAPLARPLLTKAASELGDVRRTIALLWPPQSTTEVVVVGGAVLDGGTREEAQAFVDLAIVCASADASIRDVSRRICERRLK